MPWPDWSIKYLPKKYSRDVPLCAADDSHHRENYPNGEAKVHIKYHYRQPGDHPNYLDKDTARITSQQDMKIKSEHESYGDDDFR